MLFHVHCRSQHQVAETAEDENRAFFSSGSDQWEVTLPPSISLLELFAQRSVYTLTDGDDDRLSANCWLANPALEEPDAEPEVVKCDLLAWCKRYLPDLELEEELKKDTEDRQEDIVRPKRPRYRVHLVYRLQSVLLPPTGYLGFSFLFFLGVGGVFLLSSFSFLFFSLSFCFLSHANVAKTCSKINVTVVCLTSRSVDVQEFNGTACAFTLCNALVLEHTPVPLVPH